jgi:hypothetical protein
MAGLCRNQFSRPVRRVYAIIVTKDKVGSTAAQVACTWKNLGCGSQILGTAVDVDPGSVPGVGVTLLFGLGSAAVTGRRFSPDP